MKRYLFLLSALMLCLFSLSGCNFLEGEEGDTGTPHSQMSELTLTDCNLYVSYELSSTKKDTESYTGVTVKVTVDEKGNAKTVFTRTDGSSLAEYSDTEVGLFAIYYTSVPTYALIHPKFFSSSNTEEVLARLIINKENGIGYWNAYYYVN